jgi:hypothetical protein
MLRIRVVGIERDPEGEMMSPTVPTRKLPRRRLGDSELEVSVVGLGCNNFGRRLDLEGTAAVLGPGFAPLGAWVGGAYAVGCGFFA